MPASAARNLCTLSAVFRSTIKPKTDKFESSPLVSWISEDNSSELDTERNLSIHGFLNSAEDSGSENSLNVLSNQISSILCDGPLVKSDRNKLERTLDMPRFPSTSHGDIKLQQKEVSRCRKEKWMSKQIQGDRFERVIKMCADTLGTDATLEVIGKVGKEASLKEFNALIVVCTDKARAADDEEVVVEEMGKAFNLFKLIREKGYQLQEQTYGPLLLCLIDMGMVEAFQRFFKFIKADNPSSISRLGYYEMMLWLRVNNEEKIQDLCNYVAVNNGEHTYGLQESYLLAHCESDQKEGLLKLLEIIDITKLSSAESVAKIFQSLGRLLLESDAEKILLAFKTCDHEADNNNITNFIASYAVSIPNLVVDDVILKFKDLHQKLEVSPSSSSYEKLISYSCCDLLKVHVALDIVDEMCEAGFILSTEVLNSILRVCEETYEYNLVHRIYSMICHYNLKSTVETFRLMINLYVRMKDFQSAYKMFDDLEEMSLKPMAGMYNAIMAGYFREKNINGALRVFKEMQGANVKPDSHTFNYLISNSNTEEDIIKYYKEMNQFGVQATKQILMALINAYAACGQFKKAKQVVLDAKTMSTKSLNEIKSVLVSALASHGQLSESILMYENIKKAGHSLEPKAVINLIDCAQSDGELDRLLLLLEELTDPDNWMDGCFRIIMFCVQNKYLSSAVDLFKQLKDKFQSDELLMEILLDQVFSAIAESDSTYLKFGLDFFQIVKKELGVLPSRQCLDFLLSACANAKDLRNTRLIWREYAVAGFPYNPVSYLRMYQALMASGDFKSAHWILQKIPIDDPHVYSVIKACQQTYHDSWSLKENEKKRKEKKFE